MPIRDVPDIVVTVKGDRGVIISSISPDAARTIQLSGSSSTVTANADLIVVRNQPQRQKTS
jgi:hypothetical protein